MGESGELCGCAAHPAGDVFESSAAMRGVGVDDRKGEREAGDAAPGLIEAASVDALPLRRAWGVVRDDHVDDAIVQAAPEGLLIFSAADWWGALQQSCTVGDIFGGEVQIVWAGLDCYG